MTIACYQLIVAVSIENKIEMAKASLTARVARDRGREAKRQKVFLPTWGQLK
jgi:hypothetical protein